MKPLKYVLISTLATLGIFSSVLYTSCSKSKCGSTTCQNGGACVENKCSCPTGYSGNNCGGAWTDASVGTYKCTRSNCVPAIAAVSPWLSSVTKAATNGGYTINISNFDNGNVTVAATVDSANNISIAPASGSYGISATGSYVNGTITLEFTTSSTGGVGGYTCKMQMVKE